MQGIAVPPKSRWLGVVKDRWIHPKPSTLFHVSTETKSDVLGVEDALPDPCQEAMGLQLCHHAHSTGLRLWGQASCSSPHSQSFISPLAASNRPDPVPAQPLGWWSSASPTPHPRIVHFVLPTFSLALLPGASPEREGILSVANKNTVQIILK